MAALRQPAASEEAHSKRVKQVEQNSPGLPMPDTKAFEHPPWAGPRTQVCTTSWNSVYTLTSSGRTSSSLALTTLSGTSKLSAEPTNSSEYLLMAWSQYAFVT
jgi:hypothetical protein